MTKYLQEGSRRRTSHVVGGGLLAMVWDAKTLDTFVVIVRAMGPRPYCPAQVSSLKQFGFSLINNAFNHASIRGQGLDGERWSADDVCFVMISYRGQLLGQSMERARVGGRMIFFHHRTRTPWCLFLSFSTKAWASETNAKAKCHPRKTRHTRAREVAKRMNQISHRTQRTAPFIQRVSFSLYFYQFMVAIRDTFSGRALGVIRVCEMTIVCAGTSDQCCFILPIRVFILVLVLLKLCVPLGGC